MGAPRIGEIVKVRDPPLDHRYARPGKPFAAVRHNLQIRYMHVVALHAVPGFGGWNEFDESALGPLSIVLVE
jgi:hypothetical protein